MLLIIRESLPLRHPMKQASAPAFLDTEQANCYIHFCFPVDAMHSVR
jgi:hypothetical protein